MAENNDVLLDLNINNNPPKSGEMFGADQTPTPTKLFKNCEEYGIFEDLKHVNPFDEIFRHAVEEKSGKTPSSEQQIHDEESLHTPQVFPQMEATTTTTAAPTPAPPQAPDLTPATTSQTVDNQSTIINDLLIKDTQTNSNEEICRKKYRPIAEKPATTATAVLQLTQPQLVTVNFTDVTTTTASNNNIKTITGTAIPVQTVKPLILPKVETRLKPAQQQNSNTCTVTSPSSASLTPTSQLPIKERLKVSLNSNSKSQRAQITTELPQRTSNSPRKALESSTGKYDQRCMERRRAAATRYRNKMRNEHKELRRRNVELQTENEKLRTRIAQLEQQLSATNRSTAILGGATPSAAAQIQIPPASIHLIMNIPKLVVPVNGPPLLHNSITYSVEKK